MKAQKRKNFSKKCTRKSWHTKNKERDRAQPAMEETKVVNLGGEGETKEVRIGSTLDESEKELLKEFIDVFAWSYQDMPGIYPEIVQDKIPTYPSVKPVKQKLRKLRPEWSLKRKERGSHETIGSGFTNFH